MSDVVAFLVVLACIIPPNQSYAAPSCTAEPNGKWPSDEAMKAKVGELVHRDDLDVLVGAAIEPALLLVVDFDRDLRLAFDHVKVGDHVAAIVPDETGAAAFRDGEHVAGPAVHHLFLGGNEHHRIACALKERDGRFFVRAQLAGDLLGDPELVAGTGLYGLSPEFQDDRVDMTTRGFLALTVACAQCHTLSAPAISKRFNTPLSRAFSPAPIWSN